MSFWKSLFGSSGSNDTGGGKPAAETEHSGFRIEARPFLEGGQYQVAGTVSKTIDGLLKEHKFIRADRFASIEDAATIALMKGRQLVDQQGDRLFD